MVSYSRRQMIIAGSGYILVTHDDLVDTVSSGEMTALKAVLRKDAAGDIAAQPALTVDIQDFGVVQLG